MPSKSKEQAKMMAGVCHSPEFAKKVGIPKEVGCDYNMADAKTGILKDSDGNIVTPEGIPVIGNVTMDIALLIRILEHAREELKSDNELHMFVEKLIDCQNQQEVLDMSCFDKIVPAPNEEDVKESTNPTLSRKNYSNKAMKIIDGAIHVISDAKTGSERIAILKDYCKANKVKYQSVYDAIVQDTSPDYFTDNTRESVLESLAKSVTLISRKIK